jgi:nitroreductase
MDRSLGFHGSVVLLLLVGYTIAQSFIFDHFQVHAYILESPAKVTRQFSKKKGLKFELLSHHDEIVSTFDDAVSQRYACTRYQRYDNINTTTTTVASPADPFILKQALTVLDMARRAPTGFNSQPYKLLVVSSPEAKLLLAKYCIGHNAHRVRDSDCTVLFLADRQVMLDWNRYRQLLLGSNKAMSWLKRLKIRILIAMFSSGLPLPLFLSGPISFLFHFAMRTVSWIVCQPFKILLVLPTLSSSQTWSEKNTMLVAMSYLLGCSSRNIATTPMEGYLTWGIRRSLKIPRRYTIPLIVATGRPYLRNSTINVGKDDAGLTHGNTKGTSSPRFPSNTTIFENKFGNQWDNTIVPV